MTDAAGPAGPAGPAGASATSAAAPAPGADLDRLLDKVPVLAGPREVTELAGGLTNRNYKVVSAFFF